jgi:hypothetical protein
VSVNAAGVVVGIFGTLLVALLVEDWSLGRAKARVDDQFLNNVFMLGLVSSGLGLLITMLALLWLSNPGSIIAFAVLFCLTVALFALVVPAAHWLPVLRLSNHRWINETSKSAIIVAVVWVVAVLVVLADAGGR